MSRLQDLACTIRALQLINEAGFKLQEKKLKLIWQNSSFRTILEESNNNCNKNVSPKPSSGGVTNTLKVVAETADRISTVGQGIKEYVSYTTSRGGQPQYQSNFIENSVVLNHSLSPVISEVSNIKADFPESDKSSADPLITQIKLTASDKQLLKKLDLEHREKLRKERESLRQPEMNPKEKLESSNEELPKAAEKERLSDMPKVTTSKNPKSKQKLSLDAKQRKVPSSRIGRMVSFGSLAAGLGIGTAAEYARRTLGFAEHSANASTLFMSQANVERIVDTLCKVRGAALKLGQIMSIQDENIINPELAKALERVRKSADFMPDWQVDEVMSSELGPEWSKQFLEFEKKPFAAASIGQVHWAKLRNGDEVAIKIQYPGVAKGIDSDIDNLGGILKLWNVFPKGMFLENLMKVAKRELAWEVDYVREAECTKKFKELLEPYDEYYVPDVIDELSTKQVFTTELLYGLPLDQCFDLDIEHREYIATKMMNLCLLEILEFKYMQTDPNWANFLYDPNKKQLLLLDFGASREYSEEFINKYVQILKGACDNDRDVVLRLSQDLGFLTGYESKIMENAHVDAVMILGEVFREKGKYDFSRQDMTQRIQDLAQTMLQHRLCPPPEEVYSLHRKLSGLFLLCAKLKVAINCRDTFLTLYKKYSSHF